MFFDSWEALLRILVNGTAAYLGLVAILRISGKRSLSKMNTYDFIVTVALGSVLSSGILQKSVTLSETLFAIATLVGLQYLASWCAVRFGWADHVLKSEPTLLFRSGSYLRTAMRKSRISEDEIKSAARAHGFDDLGAVEAVVLEPDGEL